MPYLYVLESLFNATDAFKKLSYGDYYQPTSFLPFPYLANRTQYHNVSQVVGVQPDLTLSTALFFIATHK
jgi:hypothetical protein